MSPAADRSPSPPSLDIQRFRRVYLGPLVALLLALKLVVAVVWLGMTLPIRWDLSFPEAAVVARAVDVARGERPYHDWRDWPHAFAPYGPLTYYPAGWVARVFPGGDIVQRTRLIGRVQSHLGVLGLVILSVALLRRLGMRWPWALAGVAAALSWESLFGYVVSFRPDAPQVFFSLLALTIAAGGEGRNRGRAFLALAALFVSLWFKATSWGMVAALSFWLWRSCGATQASIRLGLFVLAGLIPVLLLNFFWEGRLLLNLIGSLDNGIDAGNFGSIFRRMPMEVWFILLFGAGVAGAQWTRAPMESPAFLLAIGTLCSIGATLVSTLKVGADVNYYLEPFILCGVWTVYGVWRLWEFPEGQKANGAMPMIALRREIPLTILLLPFLLLVSGRSLITARDSVSGLRQWWVEAPIMEHVRGIEGPVLTVYPCLALVGKGDAGVLDHFQYRVLADRGLLNRSELLGRVRTRYFEAIVIEGTLERPAQEYFLPEFHGALLENYEVSVVYGVQTVLTRRRPASPLPTA
jgi:hypothetical protein